MHSDIQNSDFIFSSIQELLQELPKMMWRNWHNFQLSEQQPTSPPVKSGLEDQCLILQQYSYFNKKIYSYQRRKYFPEHWWFKILALHIFFLFTWSS